MHNIKDIRKDFENFKDKLKNRNIDINLDNIISLDEENRNLIQKKEKFEMEKKTISKSKDQSLFEKSKELSLKIEEINKNQIKLQSQITDILSSIPNIPLNDVPIGQDENSNKEIEKKGEIKVINLISKKITKIKHNLDILVYGQGGLLDIIYKDNHVWVSYSENRGNWETSTSIAKGKFDKKKINSI